MKKQFTSMLLFAAAMMPTMMPAQADAVVEDLLLRRQGSNVNVRVNLYNPDEVAQQGPVQIDLSVRADEASPWIPIKTWNDISNIKPGNRIARDFFDENNTVLKDLAARGAFQARAVVRAPGVAEGVEKTSWYNTNTGE